MTRDLPLLPRSDYEHLHELFGDISSVVKLSSPHSLKVHLDWTLNYRHRWVIGYLHFLSTLILWIGQSAHRLKVRKCPRGLLRSLEGLVT